ncbi:MAG: hypothetical protein VZR54_07360 [Ruminococcus sp.]|nr:hypothetical protein [Ruminococcus sp.]
MNPTDVLLIDYYYATVATVGGDGYDEIALYEYTSDDSLVMLNVYSKTESDDIESCISYLVPREAVDKCMEAIEKSGLRDWRGLSNPLSMTGALIVCKFRDSNGSYVRVSSEAMPEDGKEKLSNIAAVLGQYIKEKYKIQRKD